MKSQDKSPHYIGHRDRLRKKFAANRESVSDYELLEILLFYVFQRKDTKPLAKALLSRFQSLKEIILADRSDLKATEGIGESTINLIAVVHEIFNRMQLEKIVEFPAITSTAQVLDYYKNVLGRMKREQLRIMFLNNKNKLIAEELMQEGTVNTAAVYPREIIRKALEYGACAIIMTHNHPGGDPKPSRQDVIITKMIKEIAQKLDIILLDHVIIGRNETISLKELGVI